MSRKDTRIWTCDKCGAKEEMYQFPKGWEATDYGDLCNICRIEFGRILEHFFGNEKRDKNG